MFGSSVSLYIYSGGKCLNPVIFRKKSHNPPPGYATDGDAFIILFSLIAFAIFFYYYIILNVFKRLKKMKKNRCNIF